MVNKFILYALFNNLCFLYFLLGTEWMDYFFNTQEKYINDGGNLGYLAKKKEI
jgi:hypothetical protein